MRAPDTVGGPDPLGDVLHDLPRHRTGGGGEGHPHLDVALVGDVEAVDEPQIVDIERDLGVVDLLERLDHAGLELVRVHHDRSLVVTTERLVHVVGGAQHRGIARDGEVPATVLALDDLVDLQVLDIEFLAHGRPIARVPTGRPESPRDGKGAPVTPTPGEMRTLHLVLGDQLDAGSAFFEGVGEHETVLLLELDEEATFVRQHKHRLVLFFAAMRHFAGELEDRGHQVLYSRVDDPENAGSFGRELARRIAQLRPERVRVREPGDWRVRQALESACEGAGIHLEIVPDDHFLCATREFAHWRRGRKQLVMEHFYRSLRKRERILMNEGEPEGGRWNFDQDNRASFGKKGPPAYPEPPTHRVDAITREVIALVDGRYADHPGDTATFSLPVTRRQARYALRRFVEDRLPTFGKHQDAMALRRPFLSHSVLSTALNLQLLHPREVIRAAATAYTDGHAPLTSVEGFIRQVLGWREFVRGIYMTEMPGYAERNALQAEGALPESYWTGETEMVCVRECMGAVLTHGYAHHIQRLMVLGLYAMLLGVDPWTVHEWHLAMYADAIDWVSLPNVLGMSQFGDGGLVGTKPYAASGAYVNRMSDYCGDCRFDPKQATGEDACPMTTLYWDFLRRHRDRLSKNHRMGFQLKNLARKDDQELVAIGRRASRLRRSPP